MAKEGYLKETTPILQAGVTREDGRVDVPEEYPAHGEA